jgi:polyisoprenoid-binding protein YceI
MHKFALLLSALALCAPAHAARWMVDPTTSQLTFEGMQGAEPFKGSFTQFQSAIELDETAPEKGKIAITIAMASAVIDGKDRMDSLPTDDWFAVKQFPTAQFTSTAIRAIPMGKTGVASYVAEGMLTIRGISKAIAVPFTLQTTGTSTIARGNVTLNRNDYSIGLGQWKTDTWIKFPVHVHFELRATKSRQH